MYRTGEKKERKKGAVLGVSNFAHVSAGGRGGPEI